VTAIRRDGGSILVITLGFLVVALMLVLMVVDASDVYLARRSLAAAADAAALDAADHPDLTGVYAHGAAAPTLNPADITLEVEQFRQLGGYPPSWMFTATATGPDTAKVRVSELVTLPVVGRVTVTATSLAAAS
jgi:uncharacterized membrane protein